MGGGAFRALHFAVRGRVVARQLGRLMLLFAAFTTVPAVVAAAGGRLDIAARYAVLIVAMTVLGAAGARLPATDRIQANEALIVSTLVFLVPGLALAYPMAAYGIPPLDAIFESVSGVTTTGLSTLASVEHRPRSFLFARAWSQWVGGLGVVVLALAFVVPSGVAAKRLGFDDREAADYVGGTRAHARRLLLVYAGLTAVAFGLCWAAGMGWFDALAHGLASVSTGGFATADASLAAMPPAAQLAVCALSLGGAVSFSLYYRLSPRALLRDGGLWALLGLTALAALGVGLCTLDPAAPLAPRTWIDAVSMAGSAQSTAGFSTVSTGELPGTAKLVLLFSMVVGGEPGSTAGGLKVLRLLILVQLVVMRVLRASMPRHSVMTRRLTGHRVEHGEVEAAAALLLAYLGVAGVSWGVFVAYGHDPLDSLFEVVSALSTVGLSTGISGPELAPVLKTVLCIDMLLGRVELFAFFVLVFPGTWIGRRRPWRSE